MKNKEIEKIYTYIVSQPNGNFKIGRSNNPIRNLMQLQRGNGERLELLITINGDIEQILHKLLKNYNLIGEWYESIALSSTLKIMLHYLTLNKKPLNIIENIYNVFHNIYERYLIWETIKEERIKKEEIENQGICKIKKNKMGIDCYVIDNSLLPKIKNEMNNPKISWTTIKDIKDIFEEKGIEVEGDTIYVSGLGKSKYCYFFPVPPNLENEISLSIPLNSKSPINIIKELNKKGYNFQEELKKEEVISLNIKDPYIHNEKGWVKNINYIKPKKNETTKEDR